MFATAQVAGAAQGVGNAQVVGEARVFGEARVSQLVVAAVRSDGHTFALIPCADDQWRVTAGCRYLTIPEARAHWTTTRGGTRLGAESLAILDLFQITIDAESK